MTGRSNSRLEPLNHFSSNSSIQKSNGAVRATQIMARVEPQRSQSILN